MPYSANPTYLIVKIECFYAGWFSGFTLARSQIKTLLT